MSDIARLIHMLQASAARLPSPHGKPLDCGRASPSSLPVVQAPAGQQKSTTHPEPIPCTLLEALEHATKNHQLPRQPTQPLSEEFKLGLKGVLSTINTICPPASLPVPAHQVKEPAWDIANDLAVANSKRIFAVKKDQAQLETIVRDLGVPLPESNIDNMAGRFPSLTTSNLPPATSQEQSATASPARGTAMLNSIFKSVRVPEFRFKWQFWAEKGQQSAPSKDKSSASEEYASRPKPLGEQIISVKEFYQHFNNIPVESLKLRDSIHLFHVGVKPLWEDPRNTRGGAYYFRISKDVAAQFWHEICLLAVGDILQGAVETKRESFNDDICGISYSVRWNAVQIAVWNRDADNETGKEKLLATILDKLSDELKPKKDSYWYKPHKDHKGFIAPAE